MCVGQQDANTPPPTQKIKNSHNNSKQRTKKAAGRAKKLGALKRDSEVSACGALLFTLSRHKVKPLNSTIYLASRLLAPPLERTKLVLARSPPTKNLHHPLLPLLFGLILRCSQDTHTQFDVICPLRTLHISLSQTMQPQTNPAAPS